MFKFTKDYNPFVCRLTVDSSSFFISCNYISPDQVEKQKKSLEKMLSGENSHLHFKLYTKTEIDLTLLSGIFTFSNEVADDSLVEVQFSVDFESNKEDIKKFLEHIVRHIDE